jgi:hypothetical protein
MRGFPKITDYKKATLELGVVKNMTAITRRLILLNLANPYDRDAHKPYDLQILALEDGIPFWNGAGIDPRLLWQTSIDAESFVGVLEWNQLHQPTSIAWLKTYRRSLWL